MAAVGFSVAGLHGCRRQLRPATAAGGLFLESVSSAMQSLVPLLVHLLLLAVLLPLHAGTNDRSPACVNCHHEYAVMQGDQPHLATHVS